MGSGLPEATKLGAEGAGTRPQVPLILTPASDKEELSRCLLGSWLDLFTWACSDLSPYFSLDKPRVCTVQTAGGRGGDVPFMPAAQTTTHAEEHWWAGVRRTHTHPWVFACPSLHGPLPLSGSSPSPLAAQPVTLPHPLPWVPQASILLTFRGRLVALGKHTLF